MKCFMGFGGIFEPARNSVCRHLIGCLASATGDMLRKRLRHRVCPFRNSRNVLLRTVPVVYTNSFIPCRFLMCYEGFI